MEQPVVWKTEIVIDAARVVEKKRNGPETCWTIPK